MAKHEATTHFTTTEIKWEAEEPMNQFGSALDALSLFVSGIEDPVAANALDGLHSTLCNIYTEIREIVLTN